jgi:methylthioribose-1-phosphate isomerase
LDWLLLGKALTVGGMRVSNEESIVIEIVFDVGPTGKLDGYTNQKQIIRQNSTTYNSKNIFFFYA